MAESTELQDLVVFDFDGTLTTEDTFVGFMKYLMGAPAWFARMAKLTPTFLAYKLGRIDRHAVKRAVVGAVFTGRDLAEVEMQAADFAREVIPNLIRSSGRARFEQHWQDMQSGGPRVVVCSASIGPYLRHYFEDFQGLDILACELAVDARGVCTGELQTYNVWGKNKVRALDDRFGSERYRIVAAYGDTAGDVPMLDIAQDAHWRPFRGVRES